MDDLDNIRHRLRVSKLQATREMLEIEREALGREIISPRTNEDRREEAFTRRSELMGQWVHIVDELKAATESTHSA